MASEKSTNYIGEELTIFAAATNWAGYIARQIDPYLCGVVFEVGAGQGTRTKKLCSRATHWVAIEPDRSMSSELARQVSSGSLGSNVEAFCGTLSDMPAGRLADVILYVDVLEHIEFDREELTRAASRLRSGGHLVVLSPAHQWLFTAFDKAIGHYRRYTASGLEAIGPGGLKLVRRRMLDSVGMLASAANRFLLRSSMPTRSQVLLWDRTMMPVSRCTDPIFAYRLGKSVLIVWQKPA